MTFLGYCVLTTADLSCLQSYAVFFLTHPAPFLTQGHVTAAARTITPAAVNNTGV